jgi:hypothetical protein
MKRHRERKMQTVNKQCTIHAMSSSGKSDVFGRPAEWAGAAAKIAGHILGFRGHVAL